MTTTLTEIRGPLEKLACELGLDYYPVEFEIVPPSLMMEMAAYGLPVRMTHWSFGVRYIHHLIQHRMGHSRIFEVVFPGDPGHAFMANNNTDAENTLVYAHVLGHADFAKHNELFKKSQSQVGRRIVKIAAAHAQRIEQAIEEHGQERVEHVLDAAFALEQQIDLNQALDRPRSRTDVRADAAARAGRFQRRFDSLPGQMPEAKRDDAETCVKPAGPRFPENDLLWFMACFAPEMEDWERDIFLAVREESFYFYPVFACQIMNEGWASYWHARLLREASFLPNDCYLDAMKTHSDVVRPVAGDARVALSINPYHLGFAMWDRIVERDSVEAARRIMREEDDFGFIRNHLDEELISELGLFTYDAKSSGEVRVADRDADSVREAILSPKFNFGTPRVNVSDLRPDGELVLRHDWNVDGRGLDIERAQRVLEYVHRVWRRPVTLHTEDVRGTETVLRAGLPEPEKGWTTT